MGLNKQGNGNPLDRTHRGIEWTDLTANPIGGCMHDCGWDMPDGKKAECYAGDVARKFTAAYPQGFEHHYWHPEVLAAIRRLKTPSRIFINSMSDLYGRWVPADQIEQVLATMRDCPRHTFLSLTKNAPRILQFEIPDNNWVGVSVPPDHFLGHVLTRGQQEKMLRRSLSVLAEKAAINTTWMSFEPLSWDVAPIVAEYPGALKWAVIGAASNGPKVYQVDPAIVQSLLDVLDAQGVPVFFKGNLWGNPAATVWREYFPDGKMTPYMASLWDDAEVPA